MIPSFHRRFLLHTLALLLAGAVLTPAQRHMENLDRGVVAVQTSGGVFVGWRVLGTDPVDLGFHVYRGTTRITTQPVTGATNLVDAAGTAASVYSVRPVRGGVEGLEGGRATVWSSQVRTLDLRRPAAGSGYTYSPVEGSAGDLDGDGQWEIVVKWDPSNARDNSQSGVTGNVFLDAYRLDGTFLWRIDLGRNIRAGAHYTQFQVADYDSDGRAELMVKTAPGTRDGTGALLARGVAGGADHAADHRNSGGYILTGPEWLTVFEGATGRELATVNYEPGRGTVSAWGDNWGNRVDRFNAATAWLDGTRPSAVFQRGYYTRLVAVAWDWDGTTLRRRWIFDSNNHRTYAGQGNHNIMVGDVDQDGRDEILFGSSAIDDDGSPLWVNGLGHGDASHLGDFVPSRPGLESWSIKEGSPDPARTSVLVDARTGATLWGVGPAGDIGRGLAADIDLARPGHEMWSSGTIGTLDATGRQISSSRPSVNFRVYWDGDLADELLDGTRLDKWTGSGTTRLITLQGQGSNGTKNTPFLSADILGDWREEVITQDGASRLFIHTTTIPTTHRLYTLMHDPAYRASITWQNTSYNQPPHLGFALGNGIAAAPRPSIVLVGGQPVEPTPTADCAGVPGGSAVRDACGRCIGGTTGLTACSGFLPGTTACVASGVAETTNAGFLGVNYLNLDNAQGSQAAWSVHSTTAGSRTLSVRFANGSANARGMEVLLNGSPTGSVVPFTTTGSWASWDVAQIQVTLPTGTSLVALRSLTAEGGPNIDILGLVSAGLSAGSCATASLDGKLPRVLPVDREVRILDSRGREVARGLLGGQTPAVRFGLSSGLHIATWHEAGQTRTLLFVAP